MGRDDERVLESKCLSETFISNRCAVNKVNKRLIMTLSSIHCVETIKKGGSISKKRIVLED